MSASELALNYFEESGCLENQDHNIAADLERMTSGKLDIATTGGALPVQDELFQVIQSLDVELQVAISTEGYNKALEYAILMEKRAPKSYYGYYRQVQVHLIRKKYRKAFRAYVHGCKVVIYGIELLRKSAQDIQNIFYRAAVVSGHYKEFVRAKKIANWIIYLVPTSPTSYLRAADVYEMQGLTKTAVKILEQGISFASVESQTQFTDRIDAFQQQIEQARQCDFIIQLPLEITLKIVQFLPLRDRITCLEVSNEWSERLEHCGEAWCELNLEHELGKFNFNTIQHVKKYIRNVTVKALESRMPLVRELLASIGNGELKNLTYLRLSPVAIDLQCLKYLRKCFDQITLTNLHLIFDSRIDSYQLPLDEVLRCCPHLKQLTYHPFNSPVQFNLDRLPKEPTSITHLSIGCYRYYELEMEELHFIVPRISLFPQLVDLYVTDTSPGDFHTITIQCPNIRRIKVAHNNVLDFQMLPDPKDSQKGLQYIVIDGYLDPLDIAVDIAENSETLISVEMCLNDVNDEFEESTNANWDWKHIPKLNSPTLKKLHSLVFFYWPYDKWIGDCPVLEDIKLEGLRSMTDSIFEPLKKLPELRSLVLEDCQQVTNTGFATFFNDLKQRNSKLHTVSIEFCDTLETTALVSLYALQNLRSVRIESCKGVTKDVFQEFATNIDSCNTIEYITFRCIDGITDQPLLKMIQALPQLQRLDLINLANITDNFLRGVEIGLTATNLSKLSIKSCDQVTYRAINSARKLLKIIEKEH